MKWYGSCAGTTLKGQPCRSVDIFENGRCKLHGGEGVLRRLEHQKERQLKKIKRALARGKKFDAMIRRAAKASPTLAAMLERMEERKKNAGNAETP